VELSPKAEGSEGLYDGAPINPTAIETYRTNLEQIRNLCQLRAIECYSILQPTLLSDQADRSSDKVEKARRTALVHGFDADRHIAVFEQLYAINREVFGDDYCIDATPLSGKAELFFDHIHMNAEGSSRLAALVSASLLTRSERVGSH